MSSLWLVYALALLAFAAAPAPTPRPQTRPPPRPRPRNVSGSITLELPEALNTDVSVSTLSGDLESDWPITTRGSSDRHRWSPRRIRGTIGSGGRQLSLATVSGQIELRKISP